MGLTEQIKQKIQETVCREEVYRAADKLSIPIDWCVDTPGFPLERAPKVLPEVFAQHIGVLKTQGYDVRAAPRLVNYLGQDDLGLGNQISKLMNYPEIISWTSHKLRSIDDALVQEDWPKHFTSANLRPGDKAVD